MNEHKDPNQGEGDRASAVKYDEHVREFVEEGKVPEAARDAEVYVERDPEGAAKAEAEAKRMGEHIGMVDRLVARGRGIVERVRPLVRKASDRVRARLHRG